MAKDERAKHVHPWLDVGTLKTRDYVIISYVTPSKGEDLAGWTDRLLTRELQEGYRENNEHHWHKRDIRPWYASQKRYKQESNERKYFFLLLHPPTTHGGLHLR